MAFDLKIFNNLKRNQLDGLGRQASHVEKRRLEASLIKEASEVLRGRVTVACFEVSNSELSAMIEVVNSPAVQARFIVQQAEQPNQFLVYNRDLQVF